MKYLIISTNALGDSYLSATAIKVIRHYDENAEIDFVCNEESYNILKYLNLRTIYLARKSIFSTLWILFKIRRTNYDFVFSFLPGLLNSIILVTSSGRKKSGYINLTRWANWHNNKQNVFVKGRRNPTLTWYPTENYLKRIELPLSVFFNVSVKDLLQKKIIDTIVIQEKYINSILIHPFSKSPERKLGINCLNEMIQHYKGKADVYIVGETKDFLGMSNWDTPLICNLPFLELIHAIQSCKLFLGVDSFPIHLADAYNTNFIGLFGPTTPNSVLVNVYKAVRFDTANLSMVKPKTIINELDESINRIYGQLLNKNVAKYNSDEKN